MFSRGARALSRSTRGVVAAGDPQTAAAGARVLREGGNALDAAVAAALAACVCELPLASPLGGGVMVVAQAGEPAWAMDFFTRTPGLGAPRSREIDFADVVVDFGATQQTFHVGRGAAAVPLALPGLLAAHRAGGTLPLGEVVAPAVELGRRGYVLGEQVAYVFSLLVPIVTRSIACQELYFVDGQVARAGAVLTNADLATTLEDIARSPDRVQQIYAELQREFSPARGGWITPQDVTSCQVLTEPALEVEHGGLRLFTMPPPSSGGVLVALGLKLLSGIGRNCEFLSSDHLLEFARVQDLLLDVRSADFDRQCRQRAFAEGLLHPDAVESLRVRLGQPRGGEPGNPLGSTTHISVLDDRGQAVSVTMTNGEGSGHVLPGTGMVVNNMLGEEDIHPRGFHVDPPGTRLATMMAPTVASSADRTVVLGSGGSNRLRTAILGVVSHLLEHGVSAEEAVRAPRLHLEARRGQDATAQRPKRALAFERAGLDAAAAACLRATYPDPIEFLEPNMFFGGVHVAVRSGDTFSGAGDGRRGGSVCVVG